MQAAHTSSRFSPDSGAALGPLLFCNLVIWFLAIGTGFLGASLGASALVSLLLCLFVLFGAPAALAWYFGNCR